MAFAFRAIRANIIRGARTFYSKEEEKRIRSTTIICVRLNNQTVVMGDGQVTLGSMVVKPNARKVRRIGAEGKAVAGIAGATADAMTLLERLEQQMDSYPGQLKRACVEMAKMWRTDKYLRPLEASMIVADQHTALEITGRGDVLEPADGVIGIGSGSPFAIAAARALIDQPNMSAKDVAAKAMKIAGEMCVYTNSNFITEVIEHDASAQAPSGNNNNSFNPTSDPSPPSAAPSASPSSSLASSSSTRKSSSLSSSSAPESFKYHDMI